MKLIAVFADLIDHDVDFLTLGQYLQPSPNSLPVKRYVPPQEFDDIGEIARGMGFHSVCFRPFCTIKLSCS